MTTKIQSVNLLSMQTNHMQKDQTTQAMSSALEKQFHILAGEVSNCLILARVDDLSEKLLDELAWELHIRWYDTTASIEVKRALVKSSDKVHMYLGTPYAIEQVVQDYFGDGYVEEWFDYGGNPYMFRVVISNPSVSSELANQFTKTVKHVKNTRSHLQEILVDLSGEMNLYLASVVHTGDFITAEQVV